jgi:AGZA family xanthine/uracil permease-like MFS transporter
MFFSRGTIRPRDYDLKEYWTWKPAGEKPLIIRFFSRKGVWEGRRGSNVNLGEDSASLGAGSRAESSMGEKDAPQNVPPPRPFRTLP